MSKIKTLSFKKRICTLKEIAICESKKNSISCYSKRFAAKEAFVKALGTGFRNNINFKDLEVINDHLGKPTFIVKRKIIDKVKSIFSVNNFKIFLSISDEKKYAIAFVVISKK